MDRRFTGGHPLLLSLFLAEQDMKQIDVSQLGFLRQPVLLFVFCVPDASLQ